MTAGRDPAKLGAGGHYQLLLGAFLKPAAEDLLGRGIPVLPSQEQQEWPAALCSWSPPRDQQGASSHCCHWGASLGWELSAKREGRAWSWHPAPGRRRGLEHLPYVPNLLHLCRRKQLIPHVSLRSISMALGLVEVGVLSGRWGTGAAALDYHPGLLGAGPWQQPGRYLQ